MWTEITRPKYQRHGLRYASDTTQAEWAVIAPLMPPPHDGRGRPRTTDLRAVVNAIFYIAQSGCQWRMLPKDFPPFTTVQHYFYPWRDSGLTWACSQSRVRFRDSWGVLRSLFRIQGLSPFA